MKIVDTTEFINEGKWINLSITIELDENEKNVSNILSIFEAFQKSDNYKDPSLTIKEKDGDIIIDYGMRMNKFEEKHGIILIDFKKRICNIDKNYEIKETNINFNTNYRDFNTLMNVLMGNTKVKIDTEKETIKQWFEKEITKETLVLDVLINGQHSYRLGRLDSEEILVRKYVPFNSHNFNETSLLKEDETAKVSKSKLQEVYKNILTKLNIYSFPLSLFNNEFIFMLIEEDFDLFNIIYEHQNPVSKARDFYKIAKANNNKNGITFFRKILKKDSTLSNPILRENEPSLNIYELTGRAVKSDGYQTWIADLEHTFMTKTLLDKTKLIDLYKNIFDYGVNEFLEITISYVGEEKGSDDYTLIKIRDNGEYIHIAAENRFDKKL